MDDEESYTDFVKNVACDIKISLIQICLTFTILVLQSRSMYQKRNILDSSFKKEGSFLIKIFLYVQIMMNMLLPMLAYNVIKYESDIIMMLMDFVSIIVITDLDNWFGVFFEIILDAFYQEETLDNPDYLNF